MNRLFIFGVCFLAASLLQAQSMSEQTLKSGYYKSLEEFQNNSPALEWTKPEMESKFHRYDWNKGLVVLERLKMDKKESKKIGKLWGFFDGNEVYINTGLQFGQENKLPRQKPRKAKFAKLEILGDYAYYKSIYYINYPMDMGRVNGGGVWRSDPVLDQRCLNLKTGEHFPLTKKNMRNMLQDSPDLLAEFKKAPHQRHRKAYLEKFAEQSRL